MAKPTKLVTFEQWRNKDSTNPVRLVSINPAEVSDIEDYCGVIQPGSQITMRNKKVFLVAGIHNEIVAKLNWREDETD